MNKRRLLKLADFLETVPPRKFKLDHWQTKAPSGPEGDAEGSCGFAGCAIGWAAHAKLFRGFTLQQRSYGVTSALPDYNGMSNWAAVAELFELPNDEPGRDDSAMGRLFYGEHYSKPPTPKQVAKRIREFCGAKP